MLNQFSMYSELIDNIKSEYSQGKETDKALIKQIDDMLDFDGLDIKQIHMSLYTEATNPNYTNDMKYNIKTYYL